MHIFSQLYSQIQLAIATELENSQLQLYCLKSTLCAHNATFNHQLYILSKTTTTLLSLNTRDQSILLLFSSIFLSGNFFLTYYAQEVAQSFNIFKLYSQLLSNDITQLHYIPQLHIHIMERYIVIYTASCVVLVNANF